MFGEKLSLRLFMDAEEGEKSSEVFTCLSVVRVSVKALQSCVFNANEE